MRGRTTIAARTTSAVGSRWPHRRSLLIGEGSALVGDGPVEQHLDLETLDTVVVEH
jgi:hypothetical protein